MSTLNEVFSRLSVRRRYEVWFLRLGLADGSGAWWFRYLLMNPGRGGCPGHLAGAPVQVWATWFPALGKPQSFIQGFPLQGLDISRKGQTPFHFGIGDNAIDGDHLIHARIVTGLQGDGTVEGTTVRFIDPAGGASDTEPFTTFTNQIDATDVVSSGLGILHF